MIYNALSRNEIKEILWVLKKKKKITNKEVAIIIGVKPQSLSMYLCGRKSCDMEARLTLLFIENGYCPINGKYFY